MAEPTYPEHEKLEKIQSKSQAIGEFLDWLPEQGIHLGKWDTEGRDRLWPYHADIQQLLAEFFEIDRTKLEDEKELMLKHLREMNLKNDSE